MWDLLRRGASGKRGPGPGRAVVIVSGLPRSGTSMMMKMLEAGGLPVLTDEEREPDVDNPKGYYELERVKGLRKGDAGWLPEARGRAVKVISELLPHLPGSEAYRVLFMERDLEEVLASQRRMLEHRDQAFDREEEDRIAALFRRHLANTRSWLEAQPHVECLFIPYGDVLSEPETWARRIDRFLGGGLDAPAMAEVVEPSLYRQRARG